MDLTPEFVEQRMKQLRQLPQFKDMSDEDLRNHVFTRAEERTLDHFRESFDSETMDYIMQEKQKIMNALRADNDDAIPGLAELLYLIGYTRSLQKELNNFRKKSPSKSASGALGDAVSTIMKRIGSIEEEIRKNLSVIIDWYNKLGITEQKKDSDTAYDILERWAQEAEQYIKEHEGDFSWRCPSCGTISLQAVPHFAIGQDDHLPWNDDLWNLVKLGKITKSDMAIVLRTSEEAIDIMSRRKGLA